MKKMFPGIEDIIERNVPVDALGKGMFSITFDGLPTYHGSNKFDYALRSKHGTVLIPTSPETHGIGIVGGSVTLSYPVETGGRKTEYLTLWAYPGAGSHPRSMGFLEKKAKPVTLVLFFTLEIPLPLPNSTDSEVSVELRQESSVSLQATQASVTNIEAMDRFMRIKEQLMNSVVSAVDQMDELFNAMRP